MLKLFLSMFVFRFYFASNFSLYKQTNKQTQQPNENEKENIKEREKTAAEEKNKSKKFRFVISAWELKIGIPNDIKSITTTAVACAATSM